jgi:hypothetical protein
MLTNPSAQRGRKGYNRNLTYDPQKGETKPRVLSTTVEKEDSTEIVNRIIT